MRLTSALFQDVRFQFRHGFYYAYIVVTLIYIAILWFVPDRFMIPALTYVIFSDPSALGFFFVGGLVLLEKEQNAFDALFVTPFSPDEYLWAKALSLCVLSVLTSLLIAVITLGSSFSLFWFIIVVVLSSLCYTLLGINLAVRVRNVNQYLIESLVYIPLFLPVLQFIGIYETPLFTLLPAYGTLTLLTSIFTGGSIQLYPLMILIVWVGIGFYWARRSFHKFILLRIGG